MTVVVTVAVVDVVPPRPAPSPEGVVEGVAAVVVLRERVAPGEQEDSDLQGKKTQMNFITKSIQLFRSGNNRFFFFSMASYWFGLVY